MSDPHPVPAAEYVPAATLAPWKSNPRRNDEASKSVAASIVRFGFGNPILARRDGGEVIAGHTRLKAVALLPKMWSSASPEARATWHAEAVALATKPPMVPVRYMDLTETEAHALALADNKLGELADWDDGTLAEALRELEAAGAQIDDLGFDEAALREMLGGADKVPDDGPPAVEEGPAHSVAGEVYSLGPHRLICGDCRDPATVARLLGGRRINLAFTSPPYASQREYDVTSGFKPIPPDEYVEWFAEVQANVRAHLAEDGSWFVNIKEHCDDGQRSLYVKDLTLAHVRRWGWRFVDEFCWVRKGVPGGWEYRFKNEWEPVFHFATGAPKCDRYAVGVESDQCFDVKDRKKKASASVFDCNAENGKVMKSGLALPGNVLTVNGQTESEHNAGFPVGLPSWFIRAFSGPGDAVFDPFMGSGTTLIASAQNGRGAYGTEISPRYCDVIRRRWTRWAKDAGVDPGPGALADAVAP